MATATNEPFSPSGTSGQLQIGGVNIVSGASVASLIQTDWQGTLTLWNSARTNQLQSSDNFLSADWGYQNGTLTSGVTDPKGGTNAFTLTATSANGQLYNQGTVLGGAVTQVWSIWMRRRTGTGTIQLTDPTGAFQTVTLTGSWQKFSFTGTSAGDFNVKILTSGDAVDIAFGDCVNGSVMGRHITTGLGATATVTDYTYTDSGVVTLGQTASGTYVWNGSGSFTSGGGGNSVIYTAPSTVGWHTIAATSTADTSRVASLIVGVCPVGTSTVTVSLTPSTPTAVGPSGTLSCTALVTGNANTAVTWSVDGIAGGNSTVGTINSSGLYTAPSSVAHPIIRTIKATSSANTLVSASVRILNTLGNTVYNAKTTYNAKGDGSTDDTAAIRNAYAAGSGNIVYLPNTGNPYMVNSLSIGLDIPAGTCLLLAPGASIQCITTTGDNTVTYRVIRLASNNSSVVGGTIYGDRKTTRNSSGRNLPVANDGNAKYGVAPDFEQGDGIDINASTYNTLLGVTVRDCCAQGIQIYNDASYTIMSDVLSDNNRMQGLSIIQGHDLVGQYSTFSGTNGQDPCCGVDLEPGGAGQTITNVRFDYCNFTGNQGGGFSGGFTGATVSYIAFNYCIISNNGGYDYQYGGGYVNDGADHWSFNNCIVTNNAAGTKQGGMVFSNVTNFSVTNCILGSNAGYGLSFTSASGSTYSGNTVQDNTSGPIHNDGSATDGGGNYTGAIKVAVSPTSAMVEEGSASLSVASTVTGTTPTTTTWTVDGIGNGNSTVGTLGTGGGGGAALAASMAARASTTATLTIGARFSSSLAATASLGSTLTTRIQLSSSLAAVATASASLTTASGKALAANMAVSASLGVTFTTGIRFSSSLAGAATLGASLATGIPLSSSLVTTSAMGAALTTASSTSLVSTMAATASIGATLTTAIRLSSSMVAASTIGAPLTTGIPLSSSMVASASASASLVTAIRLAASLVAAASISATLTTKIPLTSGMAAVASIGPLFFTPSPLISSSMAATATLTASLASGIPLSAILQSSANMTATLPLIPSSGQRWPLGIPSRWV